MYCRFAELLKKEGVTAYKVHKATGVAQSSLSDWKNGKSTPKYESLKKIADYFGVTVDYLLGNEEIPVAAADGEYDDLTEEQIAILENLKAEFRASNIKNK